MELCDMLQSVSLEENASKRRVPENGPWSSMGWIVWTDAEWDKWLEKHPGSRTKRDYKNYYEAKPSDKLCVQDAPVRAR